MGSFLAVVLQPISEKLGKSNHATWRTQVLATLCGARLQGYVTGKKKAPAEEIEDKVDGKKVMAPNFECEDWLAANQQVFSFLLASVSKEILVRIAMAKTAAEAWTKLVDQFTSHTRAHAISMCMALVNTRKGNLLVAEYLAKMQSIDNDMSATGKPLDDEDLVQYILARLDEDYDSVVNSILVRPQAITVSELASQMLAFESRVDLRSGSSGSSANFAKRGGRDGFSRGSGRGRGGRGGQTSGPGRGGRSSSRDNSDRLQCQVCLKHGHIAERCWYRFDEDYVPEQMQERHTTAAATSSYNVDTN
jgi:hypothetical protein